MWQALIDHFRRYPAQERVVRLMIRSGLRIDGDEVKAGHVGITDTAIARAAGVDRRIVRATVQTIAADPQLSKAFSRFQPTLHLKDVAPALGAGVLEVVAQDAHQVGILAAVAAAIAEAGLSIRQAIVEDPEFTEDPVLYVVTDRPVPPETIPVLQRIRGVRLVSLRGVGEP